MPNFDGTGPEGQGSQTGRKLGKCNPNKQKRNYTQGGDEFQNEIGASRGRRMGFGFRFGRGKGQGPRLRRNNA